jgi:hypothetical protein
MYFQVKKTLKNNRNHNHTSEQANLFHLIVSSKRNSFYLPSYTLFFFFTLDHLFQILKQKQN